MTAPKLEQMKYWIVKPAGGYNYIKNPRFDTPDGVEDWTANYSTIAVSDDYARRGAYSMKVVPSHGINSYVTYSGLSVTAGLAYTFSCDIKGVAGQAMRIYIGTYTAKTFTATGYWQRVQVTSIIPTGVTTTYVVVQRDSALSVDPFYVDGVQFEQAVKMSTFISGYEPGCGWVGLPRNSTSWRDPLSAKGGTLLCINDYAKVITSYGLGMGDWNQIMTKMTSGGDMYQTHIRKSRNFTLVLAYSGDNQGDLQANRKVILDALRPDLAEGQQRIIRYQGFDENGNEATEPVDIICVFQPSHNDTPDTPVYQKDILNFTVPSGLFQGAYNEGKVLDLYAQFPAEHIVKRDPQGNWCKWNGSSYDNSMKGQGTVQGLNGTVYCIAEGPDGKIYVGGNFTDAGGVANADYLARWNPVAEQWESVIAGINAAVYCMDFDANGDLYIGGNFTTINSITVGKLAKIINLAGTPSVGSWGGSGIGAGVVNTIVVTPLSSTKPVHGIFIGGSFTSVGGVANTSKIARWNGTAWEALSTGLNDIVNIIIYSSNGILYIGGGFTDTAYPYLCKWNGTAFSAVGTNTDINGAVYSLAFDESGNLYVGGNFTNAGGIANADYIAYWNGASWSALGVGADFLVYKISVTAGKIYTSGKFTTIGGLTITDRIAVWSNGAWQPLDIDLPGTSEVLYIFPASDGSLYFGGVFSTTASSENAKAGIVSDELFGVGITSASANTYPVISFTGPGTLKSIMNHRTGKSVMFDGLTFQPGEWASFNFDPLQLSFRSGWAGRGNLMRYIIPGSDYGDFYLSPGANYISVFMTDTDSNSNASIVWTPKFWGLDGALL